MKVRFLVSVAGISIRARKGQIIDLPEVVARAWADGKRAVLHIEEPPASVTTDEDAEGATDEAEEEAEEVAPPAPKPPVKPKPKHTARAAAKAAKHKPKKR